MAYDRERKEQIDSMGVADLVHTMMVEFDPHWRVGGEGEPGPAYMQSIAYTWAMDRLTELLPLADSKEQQSC